MPTLSALPSRVAANIKPADYIPIVDSATGGVTYRAAVSELQDKLAPYGTGSPEGVETATVGTLFIQTDGLDGKTLWRKRTGAGNTGWALMQGDLGMFNVQDYGAKGDKSTDDLAAFNACTTAAVAAGGAIWVPPLPEGFFYRLSSAWVITGVPSLRIWGSGIRSLLLIANAAGQNAITIDNCIHSEISGLGIAGIVGSGHGIEYKNSSHWPRLKDVWVGQVDGDGVRVTSAVSGRAEMLTVNINIGFRPANLAGTGLVEGSPKRGLYIASHVSGVNNNWTCVNCDLETVYEECLKVGDANGAVDSFLFIGGTIQGSSRHTEVYLRTRDAMIIGTHIEPPPTFEWATGIAYGVGEPLTHLGTMYQVLIAHTSGVFATDLAAGKWEVSTSYVVTFDGAINSHVSGGSLQGDVQFKGACYNSGVEKVRGSGFNISAESVGCYLRDLEVSNITGGPAKGLVKDRGLATEIINVRDASNEEKSYGYKPTSRLVTRTTGRDYDGSQFNGWSLVGGAMSQTVSGPDTAIRTVFSAELTQFLQKSLGPIESLRGRWVTVDAWLTNASATPPAYIAGIFSGIRSQYVVSHFTTGVKERVQAAFYVKPTDTEFQIRLTGTTGTDTQWHSVEIYVEGFVPEIEAIASTAATVALGVNGYCIPQLLVAASATDITAFSGGEFGKRFTLVFTGARTIVHDAALLLLHNGANFTGVAGDTITFTFASDGKYREVARSGTTGTKGLKGAGAITLASGASTTLSIVNSAMIFVAQNNASHGAVFFATVQSATVVEMADPTGSFAVTDTAGQICVFKAGGTGSVTLKNNSGGSLSLTPFIINVAD